MLRRRKPYQDRGAKPFGLWLRRCALVCATCTAALGAAADTVHVFAAASLKNALDEIAAAYQSEDGPQITLTYAGSAALARQIVQGAPADIFISANQDWGAWLENQVDVHARQALTANQLVVVAGPAILVEAPPQTPGDLAILLHGQRIAIALTQAVPAGIYGREALEHLDLWDGVQPHLVEAENVRAALALAALGAVPFGIVYASDAQAEPRVATVFSFPEDSHSPIRYPALRLSDAPEVKTFYDALLAPSAQDILEANGFTPLARP